ncbi:hypothetical protein TMES_02295 [Thalassospira mesophila]|uniref:Uncharacterized protein n=1 Tax=Thalassospira mesophila TaxID=1293891 RepID=A0A1Y2L4X4_9PROT|nr:hypothetical protein TMES_02295 [Thalassospira mesophila]
MSVLFAKTACTSLCDWYQTPRIITLLWDSGGIALGKKNTRKRRLHPDLHIAYRLLKNYGWNVKNLISQSVRICAARMGHKCNVIEIYCLLQRKLV